MARRHWTAILASIALCGGCAGAPPARLRAEGPTTASSIEATTTSQTAPPTTTTSAAPTTTSSMRPSTTATDAAPPSIPAAAEGCFPHLAPGGVTSPPTHAISGWPSGSPSLMVLTTSGELWVIRDGTATNWHEGGLLWARWAQDGTLYATTGRGSAVELLHLARPGEATTVERLPFTVKADAPEGSCPINGYLAGFALGPEGLVLIRHSAGPREHSCPAVPGSSPAASDPWRCRSKDSISFEVRTGDFRSTGRDPGMEWGGTPLPTRTPLVSDGANTTTIALKVDESLTVTRIGGAPPCCSGGQSGTAFALSSDGSRLAYSPDGHVISVATLYQAQDGSTPLATSADAVTSLAWTKDWIS